MGASPPVIETERLTKTYGTKDAPVTALEGVSLRVFEGQMVAIMGPSGSGKSTLLNLLGCLDKPSDGVYRLRGQDVSRMGDDELARIRNREIGFVFQQYNLLPRLTALQNVELPLVYRSAGRAERRRTALSVLKALGLEDRTHHRPAQLSGGQQQRVAIARALAMRPSIILADEPTGNLDSRSGDEVMGILRELNRRGITMVLVTHDDRVARHAGRIVRLFDGHIVEDVAVTDRLHAPPVSLEL